MKKLESGEGQASILKLAGGMRFRLPFDEGRSSPLKRKGPVARYGNQPVERPAIHALDLSQGLGRIRKGSLNMRGTRNPPG